MPSKPPSISDALDRHIKLIEVEHLPDGKYHPSSFWLCGRATILAVRGVEKSNPPDLKTKRVFRIGHMMHELVQEALRLGPFSGGPIEAAHNEFEVDIPEWNMAGHGDTLLLMENGDAWVIEIKSTKSLRYTPKEDHEKQAAIYTVAARDFGVRTASGVFIPPLGDRLKGLILVYLAKNDMEIKEYVIPYKASWRPMIEKRVEELDKYRLRKLTMLPPPLRLDKGRPNWYTGYCNYKSSGLCCGDPPDFDPGLPLEKVAAILKEMMNKEVLDW